MKLCTEEKSEFPIKLYTEEQKKLLIEIMEADEKDGLYDHIGDTNKMVTMKLYTEKQVKDILSGLMEKHFIDEFLEKYYTPIELPSDEEIEQEAHIQYPVNLQPNGRTLAGGKYDVDINYSERNAFIKCAKWVIEQIKKQK